MRRTSRKYRRRRQKAVEIWEKKSKEKVELPKVLEKVEAEGIVDRRKLIAQLEERYAQKLTIEEEEL